MTDQTPSPQSVVVPVEPTEAMLAAGKLEWLESAGGDPCHDVYRAMLSAAPERGGAASALRAMVSDMLEWADLYMKYDKAPGYDTPGEVRMRLAALSPEAPAREGVSDLVRRIKYQVECSSANLTKSGADSDMVRICLSHFNDLADEVAALTPRHEAPAEGAGEDVQTDLDLLSGFVQHLEDGRELKVGNPAALAKVLRRVLTSAYPDTPRSSAPEARDAS